MEEPAVTANFDEFRTLLRELPGPDPDSGARAAAREGELTKPAGSLGRLERLAAWMAEWQGRYPPKLDRARVAVFAGNHGITVHGVSAYPAEVTSQMVQNFIAGGAAVNQLCQVADAELRVYEMALDHPTQDFLKGPAMSEEECARAMAYGMMAVEDGIDLIAVGEMGIGNTTSAAAICLALYGGRTSDWVGPGTGVRGERLARKAAVVGEGVARNRSGMADPLNVLRCVGGLELAAIAGAILAARMGRVPVLLDGFVCCAAAAVLHAMEARALDHCHVAHVSAEPPHLALIGRLGKEALLDLGMRLGEASGAALAINLVRSAVACHTGMTSFREAEVSGRRS